MDELLNAVLQRKQKINEIMETIMKIKLKGVQINSSERSTIYAIIRKLKEEEKNRTEKENWIVSIMRNTKQYNEEQMSHIYVKTNDIMKLINPAFIESAYQSPNCFFKFLEQYYNLHWSFFSSMNQEYQLKIKYKQAIKSGNINLITDLIKGLLASSRKIFKDHIDDLAFQVNKDLSPQKKVELDHLRTRSSTQSKKEGTIISMTSSVQIEEPTRYIKQRKIILQPKIQTQELILLDSPTQQLKMKYSQHKDEKCQFNSLFSSVNLDDLDEQNVCVLDYQTIKRQQQGFDEFKQNFDSLLDKIKQRNIYTSQTVLEYNQYALKRYYNIIIRCSNVETEYFNLIKEKFEQLNQSPDYHFCKIYSKPILDPMCSCVETPTRMDTSYPLKNKIVIRKSVQNIRKSNIMNTFTSKNLIDQIKKERVFQHSILLEETNIQDLYRFNNSGISPANNSILQKLNVSNGNSQYKLYSHKLSKDFQSLKPSFHYRAQSANGDQLCIPPLISQQVLQ